jgi:GGDEF domain-containing protein
MKVSQAMENYLSTDQDAAMDNKGLSGAIEPPEIRLQELEHQIEFLQNRLKQLKDDAIHNQATGLYSNAYFHARLTEEIIRSERYRHFLSLILIHVRIRYSQSITQLKREIRKIGLELQSSLTRRTDIVALYCKRQVILMLPETDPKGVEQLLARFQTMFPNDENGRHLTYKALTYPRDASNIELVLNRIQDASEDLSRGDTSPDLADEDTGPRLI